MNQIPILSDGETRERLDLGSFVRNSTERKIIRFCLTNQGNNITSFQFNLSVPLKEKLSCKYYISSEVTRKPSQPDRWDHTFSNASHIIRYSILNTEYARTSTNLIEVEFASSREICVAPNHSELINLEISLPLSTASTNTPLIKEMNHSSVQETFSGLLSVTNSHVKRSLYQIPICGKICNSLLRSDLEFIDFGWCPLVGWSYKFLVVHNVSPVDTTFTISLAMRANTRYPDHAQMTFYNADSEREIDVSSVYIASDQSLRLRVGIYGYGSGQFNTSFSIQNQRNPRNLWYVQASARIGSEKFAESLDMSCGDSLEFGECYANCLTFQDIVVQNNHRQTLRFTAMSDRSDQVSFEVVQDWTSRNDKEWGSRQSGSSNMYRTDDAMSSELNPAVSSASRTFKNEKHFGKKSTYAALDDIPSSNELYDSKNQNKTENEVHVNASKGLNHSKRIDNITLGTGQRKIIRIWYHPTRLYSTPNSDIPVVESDPGKLMLERFNVIFGHPSGDNKVIRACASVCESSIRLTTTETNLGECNLLSEYSAAISIINCSDLPTIATISYVSMSVKAQSRKVYMKPREAVDVKLSFIPRQINPSYYKEITIMNLRNPDAPSMLFTLRAKCVDHQGISLHALFYKVLSPRSTNEIDFGGTVVNHPAIRAFSVMNISKKKLVLKFDACATIRLFMPTKKSSEQIPWNNSSTNGKGVYLHRRTSNGQRDPYVVGEGPWTTESISTFVNERRAVLDNVANAPVRILSGEAKQHLTGSNVCSNLMQGVIDCCTTEKEENWISFLECLGSGDVAVLDSLPMSFSDDNVESQYTERQFRPIRLLENAVNDGYLEETNKLELVTLEESFVVVSLVLTEKDVRNRTKFRDFTKHLSVTLEEFDEERLNKMSTFGIESGGDKRRDILLTVRSCKSAMNIAPLRQLNFGSVRCGEQKDKTFTIVNLSEAPLLYEICKGDGLSSEDLRFNLGKESRGIIRPYSTKLIRFIYAPSRSGKFKEEIVIRNRLDESASCRLVVKANVRHENCKNEEEVKSSQDSL